MWLLYIYIYIFIYADPLYLGGDKHEIWMRDKKKKQALDSCFWLIHKPYRTGAFPKPFRIRGMPRLEVGYVIYIYIPF